MGALLSCALVTRYGSGEPLNFFAAHRPGSGEPAAPRRQSLLRAQARYALLPAATPREGRFAPAANVRMTRKAPRFTAHLSRRARALAAAKSPCWRAASGRRLGSSYWRLT